MVREPPKRLLLVPVLVAAFSSLVRSAASQSVRLTVVSLCCGVCPGSLEVLQGGALSTTGKWTYSTQPR